MNSKENKIALLAQAEIVRVRYMNEAKMREIITRACQDELEMDVEKASDIAFHMTDWLNDLEQFHAFASSPESLNDEQVADLMVNFLVHVPNHLAAAAKLTTGIGVADIFDVGAIEEDSDSPEQNNSGSPD